MENEEGEPILVEDKENEETEKKPKDNEEEPTARETLEKWVAEQDDKVKAIINEGTAALKSALDKERIAAKEAVKLQAELDSLKTDEEKDLEAREAELVALRTGKTEADLVAETATAALNVERIKFAVTVEAIKQGFEDPEDAKKLLPVDAVKINKKTDKVEGVEEALKELSEAKPYLIATEEIGTPRYDRQRKLAADDKIAPVKVKL